jgi:hypothetical protein
MALSLKEAAVYATKMLAATRVKDAARLLKTQP